MNFKKWRLEHFWDSTESQRNQGCWLRTSHPADVIPHKCMKHRVLSRKRERERERERERNDGRGSWNSAVVVTSLRGGQRGSFTAAMVPCPLGQPLTWQAINCQQRRREPTRLCHRRSTRFACYILLENMVLTVHARNRVLLMSFTTHTFNNIRPSFRLVSSPFISPFISPSIPSPKFD